MHFGFTLDLSDIDLLSVDLLDQRYTHLDLFVSKTSWRRLQDMSSRRLQDISSRRLQEMSWRRLQDILGVTIFRLPRHLEDVFKTFCEMPSRHLCKTSSRRLGRREVITLTTCWRRPQDMSWRRLQDLWKTKKCLLGLLLYRKFNVRMPII